MAANIDSGERYVLLRRLEARILNGEPVTTQELANELGISRRSICRYLGILQTADEFRIALEQDGWRWKIFE